jgi:hypothetical protein
MEQDKEPYDFEQIKKQHHYCLKLVRQVGKILTQFREREPKLLDLLAELHELKHAGKLPKELDKFRDFIETFKPIESLAK